MSVDVRMYAEIVPTIMQIIVRTIRWMPSKPTSKIAATLNESNADAKIRNTAIGR